MPKFFIDACLPLSSTQVFTNKALDAIHAKEVSLGDADDKHIFEYSQKEKRVIITRDKGFGNIIEYPLGTHEGIIILRLPSTYTASQINKNLEDFLNNIILEKINNKLIILEPNKIRIRNS